MIPPLIPRKFPPKMVFTATMPKSKKKEKKENAKRKNIANEKILIERILTQLLKIILIYEPIEKIRISPIPK